MKRRTTKQTGSILRVLLILLTLLLLVTGCEQPAQNPDGDASSDDAGLEVGFKSTAGGCEMPNYASAYRSSKTEFDIDDVNLEFYYGGYYMVGAENHLVGSENIPSFELYFVDQRGKEILVKSVEENFVSEKYRCTCVYDENRNFIETAFNHSETLTVPKEVFLKETGYFYFSIQRPFSDEPDATKQHITGRCIHYKKVDGTVTLSDQPFE